MPTFAELQEVADLKEEIEPVNIPEDLFIEFRNLTQNGDDWFKCRKGPLPERVVALSASMAGQNIGYHTYIHRGNTPYIAWKKYSGLMPDIFTGQQFDLDRGHATEGRILGLYQRCRPEVTVKEVGIVMHRKYPHRIIASPDFLIYNEDGELVGSGEIKSPRRMYLHAHKEHICQMIQQFICLGFKPGKHYVDYVVAVQPDWETTETPLKFEAFQMMRFWPNQEQCDFVEKRLLYFSYLIEFQITPPEDLFQVPTAVPSDMPAEFPLLKKGQLENVTPRHWKNLWHAA